LLQLAWQTNVRDCIADHWIYPLDRAPEISIVVCSDGRREGVATLFDSLARLALPETGAAEVILVDNSRTGVLRSAFDRLCGSLILSSRYLAEPRPGLAAAQNCGLAVARGEVIAFTDDDCLAAEDWLLRLSHHFQRDSQLQVLGGRVELRDPADLSITIKSEPDSETLASPDQLFGFLHGCNMAVRRGLFDQIGLFDTRFGKGSTFGAGNDTEFVYRAFKAGCRIAYEPDVLVFHDHGRRGWWQARALINGYQMANGAVLMKHAAAGDTQAKALLRAVLSRPFEILARRPLAIIEATRALLRLFRFLFGALHYRFFTAQRA
jgi:GT2 family glycosyltransferase